MQGGRPNIGKVSVPLGGKQATRMTAGGQPQPIVRRPQPATSGPVRSGSREVARVDSAGLVEAGRVTGTPAQPVTPFPEQD
jgi:hypothetical protein